MRVSQPAPTWRKVLAVAGLLFVFIAVSGFAIYQSDSYLSVFWKIARCNWHPPGDHYVMSECDAAVPEFYQNDALYLGVGKKLGDSLREADVVITGNSRTIDTFVTKPTDNQIEQYFQKRHLRAFTVAQEGSGFRFRLMLLQKLGIKPKIALINTDDVTVDILKDYNREVIFNPDRFLLPFWADYLAIEMQHSICSSENANSRWFGGLIKRAQDFYCHGPALPMWRSTDFGTLMLTYPRNLTKAAGPVTEKPDPELSFMDLYWRNAQTMLNSDTWRDTCIIFYMIPGVGAQGAGVMRELSRRTGIPYVYPDIDASKNYFSYDGSHMDVDTSERWTAEFLAELGPKLDACVAKVKGAN
jgi:hypothetical protein